MDEKCVDESNQLNVVLFSFLGYSRYDANIAVKGCLRKRETSTIKLDKKDAVTLDSLKKAIITERNNTLMRQSQHYIYLNSKSNLTCDGPVIRGNAYREKNIVKKDDLVIYNEFCTQLTESNVNETKTFLLFCVVRKYELKNHLPIFISRDHTEESYDCVLIAEEISEGKQKIRDIVSEPHDRYLKKKYKLSGSDEYIDESKSFLEESIQLPCLVNTFVCYRMTFKLIMNTSEGSSVCSCKKTLAKWIVVKDMDIAHLKDLLFETFPEISELPSLYLGNKELSDECTVDECCCSDEYIENELFDRDTITVFVAKPSYNPITLREFQSQSSLTVFVNSENCKVEDIMELVEENMGIAKHLQRLSMNSVLLKKGIFLQKCKGFPEKKILVEKKTLLDIKISTEGKEIVELEMFKTTKVLELKAKINYVTGAEISKQSLIVIRDSGEINLRDEHVLGSYLVRTRRPQILKLKLRVYENKNVFRIRTANENPFSVPVNDTTRATASIVRELTAKKVKVDLAQITLISPITGDVLDDVKLLSDYNFPANAMLYAKVTDNRLVRTDNILTVYMTTQDGQISCIESIRAHGRLFYAPDISNSPFTSQAGIKQSNHYVQGISTNGIAKLCSPENKKGTLAGETQGMRVKGTETQTVEPSKCCTHVTPSRHYNRLQKFKGYRVRYLGSRLPAGLTSEESDNCSVDSEDSSDYEFREPKHIHVADYGNLSVSNIPVSCLPGRNNEILSGSQLPSTKVKSAMSSDDSGFSSENGLSSDTNSGSCSDIEDTETSKHQGKIKQTGDSEKCQGKNEGSETPGYTFFQARGSSAIHASPDKFQMDCPNPCTDEESSDQMRYNKLAKPQSLMASEHLLLQSYVVEDMSESENFSHSDTYKNGIEQHTGYTMQCHQMESSVMGKKAVMEHSQQISSELPHECDGRSHCHSDEMCEQLSQKCAKGESQWETSNEKLADGKTILGGTGGDRGTCRSLVNQLVVHSGRIAESEASGNANTVLQINQPVQFQSNSMKSASESTHKPASAEPDKDNRPEKEHNGTNTELEVSNQSIDGQVESNHTCNKEDYINSEENCKSHMAQVLQSTQSHQSNYFSTALQSTLVKIRQCIHVGLENKEHEVTTSHHVQNQYDSKTILEPRLACHESCNNCKTASNNHTAQMPEELSQICAKGVSQLQTANEKMADGEVIHGKGGDRETCKSLVNQSVVHSGRIAESESWGNANTVLQINQPVQFQSNNRKFVNESSHKPASAVPDKDNRPEKEHNGTNTKLDISNLPIDEIFESNHICNKEDYNNSEENCKSHVAQVIQSTQSHQSNYSSTALQSTLVKTRQCIHVGLENKEHEVITSHHVQNQYDSKTILETRLACHESCNNCKAASNNHTAQLPEELSQICAKGVSQLQTSNEKMADGKLIHGAGGDTETCRSLVNQLAVHSGRIAESEASGNANTVLQINQPVQFQSNSMKSASESTHKPASAEPDKDNRPEKEHNGTNTELDVSNQSIDGQIESNHICNKEDYINSEENCKSRVAQVIQSTQSHQSNYSSTALQFKLVNERQCIHDCLENKQQEEAISHHIKNQNDSKTILEPRLACHESCNNCKTASNNHTAQLPEELSQICAKGVSQLQTANEKMADGEVIHGEGGDRETCKSLVNQSVVHSGRIAESEASGNANTVLQINQPVQFQSNNEKFVNESTYEPASAVPDKDDRTEKEHNGTNKKLDVSNKLIGGKVESNHTCNKEDCFNSEENCKCHAAQVIQSKQSHQSNYSSSALQSTLVKTKVVKKRQSIHVGLENGEHEGITSHHVQKPNDSKTTSETRLVCHESNTHCQATSKSAVCQWQSNQITSLSSTLTKIHEKNRDDVSTRSIGCHGTSTSKFIQKCIGEKKWIAAGFRGHSETDIDTQTSENPMISQATADNSKRTVTLRSVSDKTVKNNNVGPEKEITTSKQKQVDSPEQRRALASSNDIPLNGNFLHSCNDTMAYLQSQKAENFKGIGEGTGTDCRNCSLTETPSNQNETRLNNHSENVKKKVSNKVNCKESKYTGTDQYTGHTNPTSHCNNPNTGALLQRIDNECAQETKRSEEYAWKDDTSTQNTKKLCTISSAFHEQNISTGDKGNKSQKTSQFVDDSSTEDSTLYCAQSYKQPDITSQRSFPSETTDFNPSFKEPKRKLLKKLWYKMCRRRKKKVKNNPSDGTLSTSSVCDESVWESESRLESQYFLDQTLYPNGKNKAQSGEKHQYFQGEQQETFAEGTYMQSPAQDGIRSVGFEGIPEFTDKSLDSHQSETDIAIQKTLIGVTDTDIPVSKTMKSTEEDKRPISIDVKSSNVDASKHKSPPWVKSGMISNKYADIAMPPLQSSKQNGLEKQGGCVYRSEELKSEVQLGSVEDDTLHNVARAIGYPWKIIARCLHVHEAEVERITANNANDCYEQAFKMLWYWKKSNGTNTCTEAVLRSALLEADRRDLADRFFPKPPGSEAKLQHCISHGNRIVRADEICKTSENKRSEKIVEDKGEKKQQSSLKKKIKKTIP